eukprot:TRINITY_DN1000_c1_g1_i1.p1 TRINITY_DN1000_c1_g1~~TRINITY_DN1000_c1_g1_i1.p1  ORF type:complete len:230 (+),score=83.25 TRINITY_DN1000_c1_g1_i1:52-741(+)
MPHTFVVSDHAFSFPIIPRTEPPTFYDRVIDGLPEIEKFVYCAFHQPIRITATMFESWLRILKRVPNSVLWLPSGIAEENIKKETIKILGSNGLSRVISAPNLDFNLHMQRAHRSCQCFLDNYIHNGVTNTMDFLWLGIPVITLPGDRMVQRVAGSLLTALNITETIAKSYNDYEDIAVKIAIDNEFREKIKQKLYDAHFNSPIFKSEVFVNHFEQLLLNITRPKYQFY